MSKTEDCFIEALSAFQYHASGCQCCDRYKGQSSELGLLCLKGSQLWKSQQELRGPADLAKQRREQREAMRATFKEQKARQREVWA